MRPCLFFGAVSPGSHTTDQALGHQRCLVAASALAGLNGWRIRYLACPFSRLLLFSTGAVYPTNSTVLKRLQSRRCWIIQSNANPSKNVRRLCRGLGWDPLDWAFFKPPCHRLSPAAIPTLSPGWRGS
jgi:hypothetical protein